MKQAHGLPPPERRSEVINWGNEGDLLGLMITLMCHWCDGALHSHAAGLTTLFLKLPLSVPPSRPAVHLLAFSLLTQPNLG